MPGTTKTRPLPAEVREKLGKLLPKLATSFDGERVAVLHAIERVLMAGGFDWHDFTAAFAAPAPAPAPPSQPPPGSSYPPHSSYDDDDEESDTTMPGSRLIVLITSIRERRRFNSKSEGFLDDMLSRANQYRSVYVSEKQRKWLNDLARQAGVI
jgi:hypothetical protein